MFLNKAAGFFPGLECNDDFFQQSLILRTKYRPLTTGMKMIYLFFSITGKE